MTNVLPMRALSQALVDQFVAFATEQGAMIANDDTRRANWLFDQLAIIENELRVRGDKGMLLMLLQHPDPWVRLIAAKKVFVLAPDLARKALEDLEASKTAPACFHAGMSLMYLDKGIWVPK
ncbi:MAG: hypothetical protein JWL62_1287 [Hyphomicrobiales bacterium]|nr:hypothetical protein [Hyphomicrobiales bacterium]